MCRQSSIGMLLGAGLLTPPWAGPKVSMILPANRRKSDSALTWRSTSGPASRPVSLLYLLSSLWIDILSRSAAPSHPHRTRDEPRWPIFTCRCTPSSTRTGGTGGRKPWAFSFSHVGERWEFCIARSRQTGRRAAPAEPATTPGTRDVKQQWIPAVESGRRFLPSPTTSIPRSTARCSTNTAPSRRRRLWPLSVAHVAHDVAEGREVATTLGFHLPFRRRDASLV